MRLDIGMLRAEELLGAVAGEVFHDVNPCIPSVIAAARIAFGVFIGEKRTGGFHYRGRGVILRRDHLESLPLARKLVAHGISEFSIVVRKSGIGRHNQEISKLKVSRHSGIPHTLNLENSSAGRMTTP